MRKDADYDVIVYGTVCLDAIWRVEALASLGGWMPIQEERKMIGGEAANTAMALLRWGVRVALVGNALGDDEYGGLLRSLFQRDAPELDLRFVGTMPGASTPYCVCIATPDGHRTMYGTGFGEMQSPELDPELARSVGWFTMDPNAWSAGLRAGLVAAEAGAAVTAMDYTRDADITRAAAISQTSSDHLGRNKTLPELAVIAASLRDRYERTMIVTCGEEGCFLAESQLKGKPAEHIPAYTAPVMIDSTGSGDIFRAGLLYGQVQGWEIGRTVRFASAAAALNCGGLGGWGGVRPIAEIEEFMDAARSTIQRRTLVRRHTVQPDCRKQDTHLEQEEIDG